VGRLSVQARRTPEVIVTEPPKSHLANNTFIDPKRWNHSTIACGCVELRADSVFGGVVGGVGWFFVVRI